MTQESLMTEAPIPQGDGSQIDATDTSAKVEGKDASTQQQVDPGKTADTGKTEDGKTPEAKTDESGKTEGEADKPAGAPEKYEFKQPEGRTFDDKVIEQFSEVAKELNLPQEAAQKMLDKVAPVIAARQMEQLEAAKVQWADSSKADKEFGGENLQANLAVAKKALDAYGTPELRTLLDESGLGNHPELIRLMVHAGKGLSEEKVVLGGDPKTNGKSTAKVLYPNNQ